jgi:tRNA A37 threonylcarbamoyladenosine modification protein TsaB
MTHVENSSVDGIVAGIGPGSFTGIKIGLAFAYGQAAARGAPMAGVSILQLVAERLRVTLGLVDVTLVQKATKGAGYFARAQSPGNSVVGKVKLLPQEAKFIAEDGQQLAILENSTSALYSLQEWGEFSSNLGIRGVAAKPVGHFDAESLALDSILAWLEDAWPGAFNESRVQARYVREPAPIEV